LSNKSLVLPLVEEAIAQANLDYNCSKSILCDSDCLLDSDPEYNMIKLLGKIEAFKQARLWLMGIGVNKVDVSFP
jgi:hypothetical protein